MSETVTDELLSSEDVIRLVNRDLTYSVLNRWVVASAVEPTRRSRGSGMRHGWSTNDIAALIAIATVRRDLASIGLPCPWQLVAELWEQLIVNRTAAIRAGTVTIHIHPTPAEAE